MRHGTLADINTGSVSKLQIIWTQSSGAPHSGESQPLVVNDVAGKPMMFFASAWPTIVQALDLSDPDSPKQVWNYDMKTDRDESAVARARYETVNSDVSYADGILVFSTPDGFIIALDAVTGKEVWGVKFAYPEHGETLTSVRIIANNKVVAGFGGAEFAAPGWLVAYDIKTGTQAWQCRTMNTDKDVCTTPDTNNKKNVQSGADGNDSEGTSNPKDEYEVGGRTPRASYGYDAQLPIGELAAPGTTGKLTKIDVFTGKSDSKNPSSYPNFRSALVTDGGLVFYGSLDGDFRAVNRKTGKMVWHCKLDSGIIGRPITYKLKQKQYISVWSGLGRWIRLQVSADLDVGDKHGVVGTTVMANTAELRKIPQGGTLYTFRLQE